MKAAVPWVLAAVLAAACVPQALVLLHPGPGFATLPIFVPVSLGYEKQMRAARGQPAARGGEEAVALAEALLAEEGLAEDGLDPALGPAVAAVRYARAALLDARGRRHALNIALMDVGVAVASELTPAQWDAIHMQRDAIRARTDAEAFDRLLEALR